MASELVELLYPPKIVFALSQNHRSRVLVRHHVDDIPWNPTSDDWFLDWLKEEGDPVREGEPVAVLIDALETTAVDLSAPFDGVLARIVARRGSVELGRVLGYVAATGYLR